ncbi:hypothetical protein [Streptomyces sp. NPDC058751]|uniref:hypothetical protein n=1 Tax=Streptomyces sp. NPDC058751 TaxID=3346623 RepID=UPI0036A85B1B
MPRVPGRTGNQKEFRDDLTRLRDELGLSLAQLEQAGGRLGKRLPPATVSGVLGRDGLPEWEFVADFLTACGLNETERVPWRQVWQKLAAPPQDREGGIPAPPPPPVSSPPKSADGRGWSKVRAALLRHRTAVAITTALALTVSVCAYAVAVHTPKDRPGARAGKNRAPADRKGKEFRKKHCGTPNPALTTVVGGECTGVTDGGDGPGVFGSALAPALSAIGEENADATRGGRYVTVAFLAPLTSVGKSKDLTLDQFVGEVEGAYTAVERANEGDSPLKIRLVLANMGSGELHWKDTVEALKDDKSLVAVTGMGLSQQESVDAARALSRQDLPMVADLITADGFDTTGSIDSQGRTPEPINGLVRVTLTNAAQLEALGEELADDTRTAALVRTAVTPNGSTDFYTNSLYQDFRTVKGLKKHLDPDADFSFDPRGGADSILDSIGQNICNAGHPIDTVYFAAREKYLPDFLQALSRRGCHRQHITVVAGSDTAALDPKTLSGLNQQGEAPITVLYASLPGAAALRARGNSDHELYTEFTEAFAADHHGQRFPADHATRGHWPVLGHDAVLTAATAIRKATTPATPLPNRYAVRDHLYALANHAVPAATGRFGIDPTGNRTPVPTTVHRLGATP